MVMAATQAGVDLMHAITPEPGKNSSVPTDLPGCPLRVCLPLGSRGQDHHGIARNNKILLRVDLLQSTVQTAITEMIDEELMPHQFSVGIYTFDDRLTQIYPSSSNEFTSIDLARGIIASQSIRTPVVSYRANTNFPAAMASLAAVSTTAGNGSSAVTPRKALIIITDGLADYGNRAAPGRRGPFRSRKLYCK